MEKRDLTYDDSTLVWQEDFDGTELNRDDWNVEEHEPGWVNQELQSYADSPETVFLRGGCLVLRAVCRTGPDGNPAFVSGRVNTRGKHDFRYGIFEARAKVPAGRGFLPAFWMMPSDEYHYGRWPVCGEIDIMEIMGQNPKRVYGTIHYGLPHEQSQGTLELETGDFSREFHTFSVEWKPDELRWYVDGILYYAENLWYCAKTDRVGFPWPAPFDQPFHIILNLAAGGSWVGSPDTSTDFERAEFMIDYVRVWRRTGEGGREYGRSDSVSG